MDWKEFFKPNWKKLLVLIIIYIIMTIIGTLLIPFDVHGMAGLVYLFPIIFLLSPFKAFISNLGSNTVLFISWGLTALFWYVISCLIIYIYNRFKKRSLK